MHFSIAEKTGDEAILKRGIKALRIALRTLEEEGADYYSKNAEENLAMAERLMDEFGGQQIAKEQPTS